MVAMKGFAAPAPTVQSSEAATQGPKLYFGGDDETRTQQSAFCEFFSEIVLKKLPISEIVLNKRPISEIVLNKLPISRSFSFLFSCSFF